MDEGKGFSNFSPQVCLLFLFLTLRLAIPLSHRPVATAATGCELCP